MQSTVFRPKMMVKKKLLIFPYNGNGIEALDCIDNSVYEFIGFIDDDDSKVNCPNPFPVFKRNILDILKDVYVLAVPGSPTSYLQREEHIQSLSIGNSSLVSIVHPKASIGMNVKLGFNCLVMSGVVITSNAVIGNHVCILPNTVIHHDVIINDYTLIGSNVVIAGGSFVGKNCYIGSGTNILNGITIGNYSIVGLGTNLIRNLGDNSKVVGNPGRIIDK